jgi:hypothetical protein
LGWPASEVNALVDEFVTIIRDAQTLIGFDPYSCAVGADGYRSEELLDELAGRPATLWTPAIVAELHGDPATAATTLAAIGDRADEADARLRAAALLLSAGQVTDASEHAEQALAFYRSVEATARVVDAERLLTRLGERDAAS